MTTAVGKYSTVTAAAEAGYTLPHCLNFRYLVASAFHLVLLSLTTNLGDNLSALFLRLNGFAGYANMPFTPIGSVGDIIALTLLVKDLIKALDESRGSSAEYQEIVRALWTLNQILGEVAVLYRMRGDIAELNALLETMHHVSNQVQKSIEPVFHTVTKFGPSLCNGGSGNSIRDASRKVQWRVSHSDDLKSLRTELDVFCSSLNVLISIAHV